VIVAIACCLVADSCEGFVENGTLLCTQQTPFDQLVDAELGEGGDALELVVDLQRTPQSRGLTFTEQFTRDDGTTIPVLGATEASGGRIDGTKDLAAVDHVWFEVAAAPNEPLLDITAGFLCAGARRDAHVHVSIAPRTISVR
jgi:hypothetical protein